MFNAAHREEEETRDVCLSSGGVQKIWKQI